MSSIDQVNKAYQKLRIKYADATHISCAYHLQNPDGPTDQEAIDDGDYGIGRTILKSLKAKDCYELAVFVVRYYGNVHLGEMTF